MDSNFVFDPIYSKKDEEEEEEEEIEPKKSKKKSHRKDAAEGWDSSVPTPPLTDHDTHSGFKLKLKLPKPAIPDVPDQSKNKVSPGEAKKKKRGEEMIEEEATTPRSGGVKLKIRSSTPVEKSEVVVKKPKPEPVATTKRHSPPRREASAEKPKIEPYHHEKRETRAKRTFRPPLPPPPISPLTFINSYS